MWEVDQGAPGEAHWQDNEDCDQADDDIPLSVPHIRPCLLWSMWWRHQRHIMGAAEVDVDFMGAGADHACACNRDEHACAIRLPNVSPTMMRYAAQDPS